MVELLVATAIMMIILTGAFFCLQAGFKSRKLVEQRSDLVQRARVALELISADLRSACRLSPDFEFVGIDRMLGRVEADNLDFATRNWQPRNPGEGNYCEISYYVDKFPDRGLRSNSRPPRLCPVYASARPAVRAADPDTGILNASK